MSNKKDQNPSDYRISYRDVAMHKVMLQDVIRTDAYEHAINDVVNSEHTVLDFGCGTGVLSMFAARAGAKTINVNEQQQRELIDIPQGKL